MGACSFAIPSANDNGPFGVACKGGCTARHSATINCWKSLKYIGMAYLGVVWHGVAGRGRALQASYSSNPAACITDLSLLLPTLLPLRSLQLAGARTILGVRLMQGSTPARARGRVEVQLAGRGWGTVWRSGGSDKALSICRALGFERGQEPSYTEAERAAAGQDGQPVRYGGTALPSLLANFRCVFEGDQGGVLSDVCALELDSAGTDVYGYGNLEVECE